MIQGRRLKTTTTLALLPLALAVNQTFANQIDITNFWYRDFLDLAQNKGQFKPGSTNNKLTLKDGSTFELPNLPTPDFSAVSKKGATTSIGGAYVVTASHNETMLTNNGRPSHHAIATQQWGNTTYTRSGSKRQGDFCVERLNKFVVETAGAEIADTRNMNYSQMLERYGVEYQGKVQVLGYRVGSGVAYITQNGKNTNLGSGYDPSLLTPSLFVMDSSGNFNNTSTGFNNITTSGDSGSGYWLYDKIEKKWVLFGVHGGLIGGSNTSYNSRIDVNTINELKAFYTQKYALDGGTVNVTNTQFIQGDKNSTLSKHKDIVLSGGGTLTLNENLDLGDGGLVFDANRKYTVNSNNGGDFTYKGAGVDVDAGTTVEWQVRTDKSDTLHKIGAGTLDVQVTQGTNLKTGAGTVLLSAEKAFNNIYIASGNGTVKVNHDNALAGGDFGGVFFAANGGTLDLNGRDFTVNRIAATDSGAVITNTSGKKSTVGITTDGSYIYHGTMTGNVDLSYKLAEMKAESNLVLDGGLATTGNIEVEKGRLTMQGHAVTHAVYGTSGCTPWVPCVPSIIQNAERPSANAQGKDWLLTNTPSAFNQPDWESRIYQFGMLTLKDAELTIGRNALVYGSITADNSTVTVGGTANVFIDGHDGNNLTGSGFGFQQNVKKGQSVADDTISFTGDIVGRNKSTFVFNIPKLTASFDLSGGSTFTAKEDSVTVLRPNGIKVTDGSTLKLGAVVAVAPAKTPGTQEGKADEKAADKTVTITNDGGTLSMTELSSVGMDVVVSGADITGVLAAYENGSVTKEGWTLKDGNLATDETGWIRLKDLTTSGLQTAAANVSVDRSLSLTNVSHKDAFTGLRVRSLTLGSDAKVSASFTDDSLSLNNYAFDKDYTLVSAEKLTDNRSDKTIDFKFEGGIDHVTNETRGNEIIFQFKKDPVVTPSPEEKPETSPDPLPEVNPDPQPETKPETKPDVTPDQPDGGRPGAGNAQQVLEKFEGQSSQPNAGAIIGSILAHNASGGSKYQEVVLESALTNGDHDAAVNTLNTIVNRTNATFSDIAKRVDRQSMMTPVRTGVTQRLASLRQVAWHGPSEYRLASASGDLSSIGRAMDLDNNHRSFYIEASGGWEKQDGDRSRIYSTAFGLDTIRRSEHGKLVLGVSAGIGDISRSGDGLDDDGRLYTLTGYASLDRVDEPGFEFTTYLTAGRLKNDRTVMPEINLGAQTFDETHDMIMSSNAVKWNIPYVSESGMRMAFKPMLLADFGWMRSHATSSEFFARDRIDDFTIDLGVGAEWDLYTDRTSWSLQTTARRNVHHSADSVGVNLSNAGGFIRYELDEDRAVLFSTNLHVSHELSRDFKIEATAGVGADTDGRESLQGSLRLHKAF